MIALVRARTFLQSLSERGFCKVLVGTLAPPRLRTRRRRGRRRGEKVMMLPWMPTASIQLK